MIRSLDQMVEKVISVNKKHRIAVAWAQDANTAGAVYRSACSGFADAIMIGEPDKIEEVCLNNNIPSGLFEIIGAENETAAAETAVKLVKTGDADIVMKGLVGTDIFLKAVMDKNLGLMQPDAVLTYVGAIEIPQYHKVLFITDPAVIPYPGLKQKIAMTAYSIEMAHRFGIGIPKIALIGASEKGSRHFLYSSDYAAIKIMAEKGEFGNCVIDGPLDLFLACDRKSAGIKGVVTPVAGDADILVFPSLESSNPFYKSIMLFGHGELGGLIMGTTRPVVLMSRSESEKSKYYCIALACLMD
ncbi:MAG TPA: phosphate acetyltransferase [Bacteroidales bacterium]|nr:phosphate acetyltransferase [Bacteroidales bacterium]